MERSERSPVVLVTGASSGIGRSTATRLATKGYQVVAGVRRLASAPQHPNIEPLELDVTKDASVSAAVQAIVDRAGRIDALVNNAGGSILGAIEETSLKQAQALFAVNFFGTLRMCQAVLPAMRRQKQGRIINVSSVVGFLPAPYMGLYAASKHALEGLSESLDHEVRNFGVRVILVEPAFTRTNIEAVSPKGDRPISDYGEQRDRVLESIGQQIHESPGPEAVAEVIERALRLSSFARLPVGGQARLLSKLRRFLPSGMVDESIRKTFELDG